MKKLVIAVALLLLTACSPSSSFVQGEVVSCESISQDPTFTGGIKMDCLDRSEGAQLGALRGPMVVNVWGSWCGPCKKEMPVLRAFHERAKDKVQLIGVDVEEANFDMVALLSNVMESLGPETGSFKQHSQICVMREIPETAVWSLL